VDLPSGQASLASTAEIKQEIDLPLDTGASLPGGGIDWGDISPDLIATEAEG